MAAFRSTIETWRGRAGGLAVAVVPANSVPELGGLKQVRVTGRINDAPFTGSTMPMGEGRLGLAVSKAVMASAKLAVGDEASFDVAPDVAPRPIDVPDELARELAADSAVARAWEQLTPSQRRQRTEQIAGAKQPETRRRRIDDLLADLRARSAAG